MVDEVTAGVQWLLVRRVNTTHCAPSSHFQPFQARTPLQPSQHFISHTPCTISAANHAGVSHPIAPLLAGGGTAHVFSGMHASGEQLNQLTGIAAILRFPLPDLEDEEFEADW